MIVCSNCRHTNIAGAIFCSECGSPLGIADSLVTQDIEPDKTKGLARKKQLPSTPPSMTLRNWVTLHLVDTGQVLPLAERNEFTLGRISEGQPIMPDVDLSPYQAYSRGVSRLHAVIKREDTRIFLMDLGSANGTFVNGKRLHPNVEHPLTNGDVVALGKLKFQILLKAT
jgi:hypothetical protein